MEKNEEFAYRKELNKALKMKKENEALSKELRKYKPQGLDELFHTQHEEVFADFDCLSCANCCKTTSPIFTGKDIERIAKYLRMKPGDFTEQYLRIDEDDDYVLKSAPCAFLMPDNYCSIYDVRPKACSEYPHTDRKQMREILPLTMKNAEICPAVFRIVERIKKLIRP